jgi:hypothetical protein
LRMLRRLRCGPAGSSRRSRQWPHTRRCTEQRCVAGMQLAKRAAAGCSSVETAAAPWLQLHQPAGRPNGRCCAVARSVECHTQRACYIVNVCEVMCSVLQAVVGQVTSY